MKEAGRMKGIERWIFFFFLPLWCADRKRLTLGLLFWMMICPPGS